MQPVRIHTENTIHFIIHVRASLLAQRKMLPGSLLLLQLVLQAVLLFPAFLLPPVPKWRALLRGHLVVAASFRSANLRRLTACLPLLLRTMRCSRDLAALPAMCALSSSSFVFSRRVICSWKSCISFSTSATCCALLCNSSRESCKFCYASLMVCCKAVSLLLSSTVPISKTLCF